MNEANLLHKGFFFSNIDPVLNKGVGKEFIYGHRGNSWVTSYEGSEADKPRVFLAQST